MRQAKGATVRCEGKRRKMRAHTLGAPGGPARELAAAAMLAGGAPSSGNLDSHRGAQREGGGRPRSRRAADKAAGHGSLFNSAPPRVREGQ